MEYETAIVISSHVDESGGLDTLTANRIEKGMDLYNKGKTLSLTFSGGHAYESPCAHAEAMVTYVLREHSLDIGRQAILLEPNSLDTVGQAIFTKRDIILPNGFKNIAVVTCEYQIPRVKTIFDFIYGEDVKITYLESPNDRGLVEWMSKAEDDSLEAFRRTFERVERGNTEAILERLFERHPLYMP